MAGIHINHLEEYLRPWLQHAEQYVPESVNTGVDLERLQSNDSEYAVSIAEQLNEDREDAFSDDEVSKLLCSLSVGITGANSAKQKRDRLKQ
jgi:hypothetical protein